MAPPTKDQLAQMDKEGPLNWTRSEFEIPDAKACGGEVGEYYSSAGKVLVYVERALVSEHGDEPSDDSPHSSSWVELEAGGPPSYHGAPTVREARLRHSVLSLAAAAPSYDWSAGAQRHCSFLLGGLELC